MISILPWEGRNIVDDKQAKYQPVSFSKAAGTVFHPRRERKRCIKRPAADEPVSSSPKENVLTPRRHTHTPGSGECGTLRQRATAYWEKTFIAGRRPATALTAISKFMVQKAIRVMAMSTAGCSSKLVYNPADKGAHRLLGGPGEVVALEVPTDDASRPGWRGHSHGLAALSQLVHSGQRCRHHNLGGVQQACIVDVTLVICWDLMGEHLCTKSRQELACHLLIVHNQALPLSVCAGSYLCLTTMMCTTEQASKQHSVQREGLLNWKLHSVRLYEQKSCTVLSLRSINTQLAKFKKPYLLSWSSDL